MLIPTVIIRQLRGSDPVLGQVIDRVGRLDVTPRPGGYHHLAQSIIHQALDLRAAATIHQRVLDRAECRHLTPERLLALSDDTLIACGLSRPKARYLRGLAEAVQSNGLSFRRLSRLPDEQVVRELTAINGIGEWTAQMYLIFVLNRQDVFPMLDVGIRNALCKAYDLPKERFKAEAPAIAESWRPYRSIASRYLWASLDTK